MDPLTTTIATFVILTAASSTMAFILHIESNKKMKKALLKYNGIKKVDKDGNVYYEFADQDALKQGFKDINEYLLKKSKEEAKELKTEIVKSKKQTKILQHDLENTLEELETKNTEISFLKSQMLGLIPLESTLSEEYNQPLLTPRSRVFDSFSAAYIKRDHLAVSNPTSFKKAVNSFNNKEHKKSSSNSKEHSNSNSKLYEKDFNKMNGKLESYKSKVSNDSNFSMTKSSASHSDSSEALPIMKFSSEPHPRTSKVKGHKKSPFSSKTFNKTKLDTSKDGNSDDSNYSMAKSTASYSESSEILKFEMKVSNEPHARTSKVKGHKKSISNNKYLPKAITDLNTQDDNVDESHYNIVTNVLSYGILTDTLADINCSGASSDLMKLSSAAY